MLMSRPLRISRTGRLGRASFEAFGTTVTVHTATAGVIATAALAARSALSPTDMATGAARARAADRLAARAAAAAGCGVLVSVGSDISTHGSPPAGGWRVRIVDRPGAAPAALPIASGGMATFRSGEPDSAWRTVTVASGSCRQARTVAVSAAAKGEAALRWLSSLGVAARLVAADGLVGLTGNWCPEPAAA